MVTLWRPQRDKQMGSKLRWQNIGPFRVLGRAGRHPHIYRIQNIATGVVSTQTVRHMHPFLKGRANPPHVIKMKDVR